MNSPFKAVFTEFFVRSPGDRLEEVQAPEGHGAAGDVLLLCRVDGEKVLGSPGISRIIHGIYVQVQVDILFHGKVMRKNHAIDLSEII